MADGNISESECCSDFPDETTSTINLQGADDYVKKMLHPGTIEAAIVSDTIDHNNVASSTGAIDPYMYLRRGDYTSEIFKLELSNLPKQFGISQLKKKLVFLGLNPCKIKTECGHFAFVTFRSDAEREKAILVLQGHIWKNRPIKVKKAMPAADPLLQKRKHDLIANALDAPKCKEHKLWNVTMDVDDISLSDKLNDTVTPLWRMSYAEQLQKKDALVGKFLKEIGRNIEESNDLDKQWFVLQKKLNEGLLCVLHPIKPSPTVMGYRNKSEFTIGFSPSKIDNTVGFRLGSYKSGDLSVLEATECLHINDSVKAVAKELQNFLQHSKLSSFNPILKCGHWQTAIVRTSRCGHTMLVVSMHPQNLTTEEIQEEKELLAEHFKHVNEKQLMITNLLFQVICEQQNMDGCHELLLGVEYIEEQLLDMTFRISPFAFFQVNTSAAEVLYAEIAQICKISSETTLVDICCGTGTIGLTMAKKVKRVVGIELCKEAVEDARKNAEINGITNSEFLCGKAEDLLPMVIKNLTGQEVLLVIDPPRAGLHSDVIRAIRRNSLVERLVYISCKPSAVKQNIVDLTRQPSKRVIGMPFRLKDAYPVDLFPHTDLYELVMLLERNRTAL